MNERIREIIEQAGFEEKDGHISIQGVYMFNTHRMEKFAELIVRECADVILEEMKRTPQVHDYWGPYWDGLDSAQKMITKHFGVEL